MLEELVDSLRNYKPYRIGEGEWFGPRVCTEAADAIEKLAAENAALRALAKEEH